MGMQRHGNSSHSYFVLSPSVNLQTSGTIFIILKNNTIPCGPPSIKQEQQNIRGGHLSPWICQQNKNIGIMKMSKLNQKFISILRSHFN